MWLGIILHEHDQKPGYTYIIDDRQTFERIQHSSQPVGEKKKFF